MVLEVAGIVAVVLTLVSAVASQRSAKRREQAFTERYGSFEGFRAQVDAAHIEEVRRTQGPVAAVKAVRDAHPTVSLRLAKRYVDELPASA